MELTPDDFLFPTPKFITYDRQDELKVRAEKMNEIRKNIPPKNDENDEVYMSISEGADLN